MNMKYVNTVEKKEAYDTVMIMKYVNTVEKTDYVRRPKWIAQTYIPCLFIFHVSL